MERLILNINHQITKVCNPDWELHDRRLKFNNLTFCLGGKATYAIDDKEYEIIEGDGIFNRIGSNRYAHTYIEERFNCFSVSFVVENNVKLNISPKFSWGDNPRLLEYFKKFNNLWIKKEGLYKVQCEAILSLIICDILNMGQAKVYSKNVEEIKEFIENNFTKKITIAEIAEKFNLHPAYCGVVFKEYTGMSISTYISHLRINLAKILLSENDFNIGEIASFIGMSDQYYFSKLFKKIVGVSPLNYRNTH